MEQKKFDRKNLIVLAIVVVAIAVVAVIASTQQRVINPTLGTLEADPTATPVVTDAPAVTDVPAATDAPEATEAPADAHEPTAVPELSPETTLEPAKAFLVVTVAGQMYEPIPLYQAGRYTITRGDLVNVIEVGKDSIMMYQSSCDNQDCVEQGIVTLENRAKRVLQNMIMFL